MSIPGYRIDLKDLFSTYNVQVTRTRGIHKFLERKTPFEYDWPDSHGVEGFINALDIEFKARMITLHCYLKQTSRSLFFQSLNDFKAAIYGAGEHTLIVPFTTTVFHVFFVKGSDLIYETPHNSAVPYADTKDVVARFTVTFREPNPGISAEPALP